MDTDVVYKLIFIGIELAVVGIGLGMFYIGGYLAAPEEKRLSRAKGIKQIGVFWLCLAFVYFVFWLLLLVGYLPFGG